ncbi:MAG: restriction endonuclease subunit S [Candidatus Omnitrophica bacterium]|nr:restriction endonuclease subunit S [Candidatus Omnitrophota bacterium]MBU4478408.1 restriction endonuclease subunit S [Candidatus Omnitrophota bacterium]
MKHLEERIALAPWIETIPEGWSYSRLDSVADVMFSNVDKHTFEDEVAVRLCNYVDVYKNDIITGSLDFMEASAEQREIDKFQIRIGDVLATKDSEEADDIAIPALVIEDLPGVICGYHLALIRPRSKRITGDFIAWLHRSKQFRAQYEAKAVGVTRFGLAQYAFRSALIPIPPIEEQIRINKYLNKTCAAIDSVASAVKSKDDDMVQSNGLLNQQMRTLRAYRNSLIYECVTGKLRITEHDLKELTNV